MLLQLEAKQDTLWYIKKHQAIKFRKLNPTLLIQNYLFLLGGGEGRKRKKEKKKESLNVRYCLNLTEVGFFTYQC